MRYTKSSWLILMLVLSLILSACNFGQEPEPTPDVNLIFTAAAETVMAELSLQLTQTALAAPPATMTPAATMTASTPFAVVSPGTGSPAAPAGSPFPTLGLGTQPAGPGLLPTITSVGVLNTPAAQQCMNSEYVADVTYPDVPNPPVLDDNKDILKVWSIKNTGTCTWDDGFTLQPVTGEAKGTWVIDDEKEFVEPGDIVEVSIEIRTPSTGGEHGGCWKMQGDNGAYFGTFLCFTYTVE